MAKSVTIHPAGTIVTKQRRGLRTIQKHARILESFTTLDKLGRKQVWYRCQELETGLIRDWPGSHCLVVAPAPACS